MVKKFTSLKSFYCLSLSALLLSGTSAFAKEVPATDAKTVAENFFSRQTHSNATGQLSYTSFDAQGNPLFYAFNMNDNHGFVIISADDVAKPVIGYSTEQGFQKPDSRSPIAFWLSQREVEITTLRTNHSPANSAIAASWSRYLTGQALNRSSSASTAVVGPLLFTKWNQSPYYNDMCPGGSVTGCVATTMAQIMRYWSYPNNGTGASSYCDCTSSGYPNNFGTLSANYGSTAYNWNNMPATISTHNTDIAQLMFHCGVSVHMNYDPAGSSAAVISLDSPNSAQNAYVNYFNYDPNTILGAYRNSFSDTDWMNMVKGDLDIGRPVQYVGYGPQGGHTWVCDGYDNNDFLHMNWGWGGMADGYFDADNLNPAGDDFSNMQQGLFGIVPPPSNGEDAGVVSISPLDDGCASNQYAPAIKIRNYGNDQLTTCNIHYTIDNGSAQVLPWAGYLVTGQAEDVVLPALTLSSGVHNITCYVSDPNSDTDVNTANDHSAYAFSMFGGGSLPVVEGFEVPSQTENDWSVLPSQNGSDWDFTSQSFSGGAQSMMINNLSNTPGNKSILQGLKNYDFSFVAHPYLYFKVAYQQKATSNNDKLSLEISNDCGKTWWTKWSKQGTALASTTALSSTAFVPGAADYTQYAVTGVLTHKTIFRWVFVSDATAPGNNVYLDDINLGEKLTVGINEAGASIENGFEVFPNPSKGEATLLFSLEKASSLQINVSDLSGRKVMEVATAQYGAGTQSVSINKDNSLAPGVYLVTIANNDGVKSSRKLVIN